MVIKVRGKLKCWKRVPKRSGARWKSPQGETVTIYKSSQTKKWKVFATKNKRLGDLFFDTKQEASTLANSYMKMKDKC